MTFIVTSSTSSGVATSAVPPAELSSASNFLAHAKEPLLLPSGEAFEPTALDTNTVVAFASIFLLSGLITVVWQTQVVPVSRTNLALDKKDGQVRDYLDELHEDDSRKVERWLFTDWLQKSTKMGGRLKEPALPILKKAKWNSGDNPVLAATALIMAGVVASSVVEKVASL